VLVQGQRLRIGEVASKAAVNIQTLRYYERRGLLEAPERTASGYREYPSETVRLIRFIKRAQDLGFTLKEIEELIALRDARGRKRSEVRALAEAKMSDIDKKLAQLQAMRSALYGMVESCACRDGRPTCPILEALDDDEHETAADEPLAPGSNHGRQ
jgi:Hg(II)-responsive transcriptional regulator